MGASKVLKIKKPKRSKGLGKNKTEKKKKGDRIAALPRMKQPALKRCPFSPKCHIHPKFAAMLLGCVRQVLYSQHVPTPKDHIDCPPLIERFTSTNTGNFWYPRLLMLINAGLPFTLLSLCEMVMVNMTNPRLESWFWDSRIIS